MRYSPRDGRLRDNALRFVGADSRLDTYELSFVLLHLAVRHPRAFDLLKSLRRGAGRINAVGTVLASTKQTTSGLPCESGTHAILSVHLNSLSLRCSSRVLVSSARRHAWPSKGGSGMRCFRHAGQGMRCFRYAGQADSAHLGGVWARNGIGLPLLLEVTDGLRLVLLLRTVPGDHRFEADAVLGVHLEVR